MAQNWLFGNLASARARPTRPDADCETGAVAGSLPTRLLSPLGHQARGSRPCQRFQYELLKQIHWKGLISATYKMC